jgi:hypothetical protein
VVPEYGQEKPERKNKHDKVMPEQKKHIDDFFRERMEGHTEAPPSFAWKAMEQKLDSTATPGSVVSYYKWLRYGVVLCAVAVLVFLGYRKFANPGDVKQPAAQAMTGNMQEQDNNMAAGNAVAASHENNTNKAQGDQNNGNATVNGTKTTNTGNTTSGNDVSIAKQASAMQHNTVATTNTVQAGNGNGTTVEQGEAGVSSTTRKVSNSNALQPGNTIAANNTQQDNGVSAAGQGKPTAHTQGNTVTGNDTKHYAARTKNKADKIYAASKGETANQPLHSSMKQGNIRAYAAKVPKVAEMHNNTHIKVSEQSKDEGTGNEMTNRHSQILVAGKFNQKAVKKAGKDNKEAITAISAGAKANTTAGNNGMPTMANKYTNTLKKSNIAIANKAGAENINEHSIAAEKNELGHAAINNTASKTEKNETAANEGSDNVPKALTKGEIAAGNSINKDEVAAKPTGNGEGQEQIAAKQPNNTTGNNNNAGSLAAGAATANNNGQSNTAQQAATATSPMNANAQVSPAATTGQVASTKNTSYKNAAAKPQSSMDFLNSLTEQNKQTEKKKVRLTEVEEGIKLGYEIGFNHFAANKYVIAPYIQYNIGRFGIALQPAIKIARNTHTSNLGSEQTYYNVTNDPFYTFLGTQTIFSQDSTHPDNLIVRNYLYTERHDSIVVSHHIDTKSYAEIEVPLLLKYKVMNNLSVYGGLLLDYSNTVIHIKEDRQTKSVNGTYYYSDTTIANNPYPNIPEPNSVFHYQGIAYVKYSNADYENASTMKLRTGYMLGASYTIHDKFMIDVSVQQGLSKMGYVPNKDVRGTYTQPYVRISAGYKFFSNRKKR